MLLSAGWRVSKPLCFQEPACVTALALGQPACSGQCCIRSATQNGMAASLVGRDEAHVQQGATYSAPEHVLLDGATVFSCHPPFIQCQLDEGHHAFSPCIRHPLNGLPIICSSLIPWIPLHHHLQGIIPCWQPTVPPCIVWIVEVTKYGRLSVSVAGAQLGGSHLCKAKSVKNHTGAYAWGSALVE